MYLWVLCKLRELSLVLKHRDNAAVFEVPRQSIPPKGVRGSSDPGIMSSQPQMARHGIDVGSVTDAVRMPVRLHIFKLRPFPAASAMSSVVP